MAVVAYVALIDAENFTRQMQSLEISGIGAGPWVPCHALTDRHGFVIDKDNPLRAYRGMKNILSAFARPADTTPYTAGDIICDVTSDVVFFSGVPSFQFGSTGGSIILRHLRLRKNNTNVVNATFRVHLFKAPPTNITYDNTPFGCLGINDYLGVTEERAMATLGDGAMATIPGLASGSMYHRFDDGMNTIYWLLEARAAYVPALGENFTLEATAEFD